MSIASTSLLKMIQWYRSTISSRTLPRCKYYPTCSLYAVTAIERFGAIRGGALMLLRLLRCRPWSAGGIDDVPQKFSLFYRFSWSSAHEEPSLEPIYHPYEGDKK
ncbi:membrane protein insertion efficiency factor YidD [Alloscardovia omnicolens]|nr:membrane protein insertion efficiency factor YidD [Clostridioides difficile]PKY78374.1 membrane protein insertion efficiency factor YidD [Alloscardovia omnicolens]PKZ14881.1 membrane protein insertion efficiency factor YidD [Alloscardovia omnicolens]